jgi:hypothetical protein
MLDQILDLVKQYGQSTIVENPAVPNQHNDQALGVTASAITTGLKSAIEGGNLPQLLCLLGNSEELMKSPIVQSIIRSVTQEYTNKLEVSPENAPAVATDTVQQVLAGALSKFSAGGGADFAALAQSFLGGQSGSLTSALDVNKDGKVDMGDAISKLTGNNALGTLAGKILG